MDTKLIKEFGEDILQYRLRTARHKKRMQYEDFDKHLIQLEKKRVELWMKRRNLGWEPLTPPIQKGWKRFFVLRDDVANSNSADFYQGILDKINTSLWSYRKDFLVRKRKFGKKTYVVKQQKLLEPDLNDFLKLDFNEREQDLFYSAFRMGKWTKLPIMYFVFSEPWRFVLRVRPNMITHVRMKDAQLESEIRKLDDYLNNNVLERRIDRIKKGHHKYKWWKWGKETKWNEKNIYKSKSITQIMDMINET